VRLTDWSLLWNFTLPTEEVARPTSGRVEIVDAAGRRVKVLADRPLAAGANQIYWDGTDDAGLRLRSGVYFVQVTAGEHRSTHKLVYMR